MPKDFWEREILNTIKAAFVERGESRHEIQSIEELGFVYHPLE
jgi:hypothetical protein